MRRFLVVAAVCAASLTTAVQAAVPKDFYGVVYDGDVTTAPAATQDAQWKLMHATGVQATRVVFSWSDAQPDASQLPSFAQTDAVVTRAAANGIDLLPIVIYAPAWAREDPNNGASPPANDAGYVAYLKALVGRYGPAGSFWPEHPQLPKRPLRTWQVWNEPQLRYQWADKDWEQGYGALLRAAHDALKQADPGCTIVLAGATNFAWDALDSLYKKGNIKGEFDVAALHPYTGSAGRVLTAVGLFRGVLKRHGDAKLPIWITELAWPASKRREKPPAGLKNLPTTPKGMALRLTRAYKLLARTRAVQRAYWYTWASGYRKGHGIFDFTGLERYDGGQFRSTPALRAYRKLARPSG
jgi:Glycosyl hydrolase catalytic core